MSLALPDVKSGSDRENSTKKSYQQMAEGMNREDTDKMGRSIDSARNASLIVNT